MGAIWAVAIACCILDPTTAWAQSAPQSRAPEAVCEQAGHEAEAEYSLPPGLLLAIGRVESGRHAPALGRLVPWPWAINAEGAGRLFETRDDAEAAARALWRRGTRSMDLGCFQINLLHHPLAFPTLEDGFDARANARYAAQFLVALHARTGSWPGAVAAYHSALPERGEPYRAKVFASWGAPVPAATLSSGPVHDPFVILSTAVSSIRIWTPGMAGARADNLPRVISPRG